VSMSENLPHVELDRLQRNGICSHRKYVGSWRHFIVDGPPGQSTRGVALGGPKQETPSSVRGRAWVGSTRTVSVGGLHGNLLFCS
jgi:hypothetical protein